MLVKFLDGTSRAVALKPFANLSGAILSGANLSGANLSGANLSGAILSGANLSSANLSGANLSYASLSYAILSGANLRSAILSGAILSGANLSGANLSSANLSYANLSYAILRDAILSGANLSSANLRSANLRGAKGLAQFVITGEGALVGYKKLQNNVIAKLRIPQSAARVNAYGSRKCRAAYVVVISGEGVSKHDGVTKYAPGKRVTADKFDPDRRVECSGGIHFFLTEQEAQEY